MPQQFSPYLCLFWIALDKDDWGNNFPWQCSSLWNDKLWLVRLSGLTSMNSLLHYQREYPALENEWAKWSNKHFPSVISCILSTLPKLSLPFPAKMETLLYLKERAANLPFLKVKGSFLHGVNLNCSFYWECFLGWEGKLLHVACYGSWMYGRKGISNIDSSPAGKSFPFSKTQTSIAGFVSSGIQFLFLNQVNCGATVQRQFKSILSGQFWPQLQNSNKCLY